MEWINIVQNALNDIEDHLLEDINADKIASQYFISSVYFQKNIQYHYWFYDQ